MMSEYIYTDLINGNPYLKDSAIRTYKSRERAVKETLRFVKSGSAVQVCEYLLVGMSDVVEAEV
jgi:hypothetical protein